MCLLLEDTIRDDIGNDVLTPVDYIFGLRISGRVENGLDVVDRILVVVLDTYLRVNERFGLLFSELRR